MKILISFSFLSVQSWIPNYAIFIMKFIIVLFSLFIHIDSRNNNRNNNQYSNMIFNLGFPEETCSTNATFESLVLFMNLCYMLFHVTLITKHLATNVTLMILYFFMYYLNVPKQAGLTAKVFPTNVTNCLVFIIYSHCFQEQQQKQ